MSEDEEVEGRSKGRRRLGGSERKTGGCIERGTESSHRVEYVSGSARGWSAVVRRGLELVKVGQRARERERRGGWETGAVVGAQECVVWRGD